MKGHKKFFYVGEKEDCLWYVQTALQLWLVKEQLGGRATKITHKLFVYRGKQNTVNRQKLLTQKRLFMIANFCEHTGLDPTKGTSITEQK